MKKILFFLSLFICSYTFGQNTHVVPSGKPSTNNFFEHYKTVINLADYGIVPDCNGTTGNGTDWTVRFRQAVADCNPNGCKIILPTQTGSTNKGIRITDSISFAGLNVEIEGYGKSPLLIYQLTDAPSNAASNIFFDNSTKNCFTIDSTSTNKYPIVNFHDFNIKNIAATPPSNGSGIVIRENNQQSQINRVSIQRFYIDFNLVSANLIHITDCDAEFGVLYCMKIGNDRASDFGGVYLKGVNIVADTVPTTTAIGVYYTGGGAFSMDQCSVSGQAGSNNTQFITGIYVNYQIASTDFRITNTWIELFQQRALEMHNTSGTTQPATVGNIQLSNIEVAPYNATAAGFAPVYISNFFSVSINNFAVKSGTGTVNHPVFRLDSITNLAIGKDISFQDYTSLDSVTNSTNLVPVEIANNGGNGMNIFNNTASATPIITFQPVHTGDALAFLIPKTTGGSSFSISNQDAYAASPNNNYCSWLSNASFYALATVANGSGTLQPLKFYTGANTSQLVLNTDGSINTAGAFTMNANSGLTKNANTGATFTLTNTNASSGAYGANILQGSTFLTQTLQYNSGTTAYGAFVANAGGLYTTSTHMVIGDDNASPAIDFALGTSIPKVYTMSPTVFNPVVTATNDLGTTALRWNNLFIGGEAHSLVDVSGTGTYSATATDYTIQFTGTTATLAYPTLNLVNGRHLNITNNGSGSLTIPSTKSGNASTITTLTTGQVAQVEYDLTNTTWILVALH